MKLKETRVKRLINEFTKAGFKQLLVCSEYSIFYLTGLMVHPGERCLALYINDQGDVSILYNKVNGNATVEGAEMLYYDDAMDPIAVLSSKIQSGVLGIEKTWASHFLIRLMEMRPDVKAVNGSLPIDLTRMIKDAEECDLLRKASALNDKVFAEIPTLIRGGITELQLSAAIANLYEKHLGYFAGGAGPAFGSNAAEPHHVTDNTPLELGQAVLVDSGKCIDGYFCDMTRTFFYGDPNAEQLKVFNTVLEANMAAEAAIKPGLRCCDIDKVARDIITKAGYGQYFTHRTGHNIGLEVHEFPDVGPNCELILQPGMAFSIEPGIYVPGGVGVRIEDLCIVTEDGVEVINHLTKEPIVVK